MKNFKFSLKNLAAIFACFAVCLMLSTGCENPEDKGKMQSLTLKGKVMDTNGLPISGVRVSTGKVNTTTDEMGSFSLSQAEVVNKRMVMKFEKEGYFTLTRSGVKENDMYVEAVLQRKGNSEISLETTFETSEAKSLEVPAGMKVKLQPQSIMRADGKPYSGKVKADMLYLDPNNENFSGLMPGGDLAAINATNNQVMLISWGMVNVNLTDESGKPLQLKSDTPAEITYPIPAGMENNPPATIPLWHFDEAKGIWIEDGVATLKGNVYVGSVTHFSWSNLDVPAERVTITGRVVDCKGNGVSSTKISVEQTGTNTNSNGDFSIFVPEWTPVTVTVIAFGKTITISVPGQPGGTVYNVGDIKTSCPVTIKGKVVCKDNEPVTFVKVMVGTVTTTTNSKGEYSAVISDNTPATVSVNANGGSDSEFVPGQPENTVYTVRNLKVPCGAPGTKTFVEKGAVKYRMFDGEDIWYYTFDEYGWRVRLDQFDKNENPNSQITSIVNHLNKYWWIGYAGSDEWYDQPYDYEDNPFAGLTELFTIDEKEFASYLQPNTMTVAGKTCKLFVINTYGMKYTRASWNGLVLFYEVSFGGEVQLTFKATAATLNVPEKAFTKTFTIDWLP